MNTIFKKKIYSSVLSFSLISLLASCGLNPQSADVDLNTTLPEAKLTLYNSAIRNLGMMSYIYGRPPLHIMSKEISDNTGTSAATKAEIPRDITIMVNSTLNGVGGGITFIPYDPAFVLNTQNTGYSAFENKLIPHVIVSGGITEFDRGLVTKGDSGEAEATSGDFGLSFEDKNKASLAQVTLDFNLIDFNTLAAIPRVQAVNGIKLHKATKADSFGFTVKSVTFGAKGTIKKVQGRHAAVRLLVELSMVQLIGRYQKLPYWNLLPGGQKDEVVIDQVLSDYYDMSQSEKLVTMQSYLYLYGYSVDLTGVLDQKTQTALQEFATTHGLSNPGVDQATYLTLFENIPVDHQTKQRSKMMPKETQAYAEAQTVQQNNSLATSPVLDIAGGNIKLWTDKGDYNIGDTMMVKFSVDKPMFVRVVVINSAGEISTLFPNVYQNDSFCKPGEVYQIPPRNGDFTLDIGEPKGTDKIRAIASTIPLEADKLYFTSNGDFDESKMASYPIRFSSDIVIH